VKFLLDQGVPFRAATILRQKGLDAVHTSEVGLSAATDAEILSWCSRNGAIAVTLDADFHAQIALSRRASPSSIRLRIQGLKGPDVALMLDALARAHSFELDSGALITVQRHGARIRRLPIEPASS
jgi:predicted nuclease of predicted toxin-antitoxin system